MKTLKILLLCSNLLYGINSFAQKEKSEEIFKDISHFEERVKHLIHIIIQTEIFIRTANINCIHCTNLDIADNDRKRDEFFNKKMIRKDLTQHRSIINR